MELVSLRCNRDFTSASSYGLHWYKYAIATQWYQFHTTDAWWFSLNICWSLLEQVCSAWSYVEFRVDFIQGRKCNLSRPVFCLGLPLLCTNIKLHTPDWKDEIDGSNHINWKISRGAGYGDTVHEVCRWYQHVKSEKLTCKQTIWSINIPESISEEFYCWMS